MGPGIADKKEMGYEIQICSEYLRIRFVTTRVGNMWEAATNQDWHRRIPSTITIPQEGLIDLLVGTFGSVFFHGLTACRRKMFESELASTNSKPDARISAAQESREGIMGGSSNAVLFLLVLMIM